MDTRMLHCRLSSVHGRDLFHRLQLGVCHWADGTQRLDCDMGSSSSGWGMCDLAGFGPCWTSLASECLSLPSEAPSIHWFWRQLFLQLLLGRSEEAKPGEGEPGTGVCIAQLEGDRGWRCRGRRKAEFTPCYIILPWIEYCERPNQILN